MNMLPVLNANYLIIGAGIVGLAIARELKKQQPNCSINIIEKEINSTSHGSGRNSGVIHAGFYYPADSLKAKFTQEGNQQLTQYCLDNKLAINQCGKLVVAQSEADIDGIYELERRAKANGVNVSIVDEQQVNEIEPNAKTTQIALYSPNTASADPAQVTAHLASELITLGVKIYYGYAFVKCVAAKAGDKGVLVKQSKSRQARESNGAETIFYSDMVINSAGLYADKIAKQFGFSQNNVIIPFKGIYLKYSGEQQPIRTNIYPVPNLKNPFLGVHFTVTVDNHVKIGPTAIPAFWRENYQGLDNFSWQELFEILGYETRLFIGNHFNFRQLAYDEMKKYHRGHFTQLASNLVKELDTEGFNQWTKPGIRAQLLNKKTMSLEQDFIVEADEHSIHILNAVSPAWTSSFPFAKYVVEKYILKSKNSIKSQKNGINR